MTRIQRYVLVVHGGAGTILRERSTPEQQEAYRKALDKALIAGYEVLRANGEAMDAAVAAVRVMEDCPLFNAGKGAVFNIEGKNELEASIMLSRPPLSHPEISPTRRGIALTLLTRVKNPANLARALYLSPSSSPHPFLSGANAEAIAESLGETLVDPSYFFTEHRWREHRRGLGLPEEPFPENGPTALDSFPTGTVGAVALDSRGCIVAVTSTGGRTNKLVGRIGDTPIFGAGFWAEEWTEVGGSPRAVGVSGTGDGDYFIRQATASNIARRVRYLHEPLVQAAKHVVDELLLDGGLGGVIALDSFGNVAMPLNCPGMYRGLIGEDGVPKTAIFADDVLS
ncbi:asparaginase [Amanita muscaria]